ncbi:MAG: TetR/AcrR family transcriptional regulator C-terminal domain-containing protein [Desulfobacterium sp.]
MTKSQKKEMLLKVASKMFAEKGFAGTSIAKMAKAAGVRETIIYELFSGKEDLLFNIPVEKTVTLIESLTEHLEGITGAENKLRKMIWHYLNFQENNREYATIILFELRPNRRFYGTKSYDSFKDYNKIVMDILKEGADEGVFHGKICLPLFRNLIFGALEHVILSWILFDKNKTPVEHAKELCDLLFAVAKPEQLDEGESKDQKEEWALDKRDSILKVAMSLFAEKGFAKTRISDIANALNIGEASIYEYFKNKEDILFSIPMEKTGELLTAVTERFKENRKAEMELRDFVREYLFFLQKNKIYTAILLFELRSNRRFYKANAYQKVKEFNDILMGILKRGQADDSFGKEVNIHLVSHMIFGSIDHLALTWVLFGKPSSLLEYSDALTWLFLKALNDR